MFLAEINQLKFETYYRYCSSVVVLDCIKSCFVAN